MIVCIWIANVNHLWFQHVITLMKDLLHDFQHILYLSRSNITGLNFAGSAAVAL